MTADVTSLFMSSSDGLRLHVRIYGDLPSLKMPILCLPGLTRNTDDFHALAVSLRAKDPDRAVIALDYRGRGQSQWARDPAHYSIAVEAVDVRQILAALKIKKAIFIGTSRGGLITMVMAVTAPALIGAVILNDIGPVLETDGLKRIASYVGQGAMPKTWDEAVMRMKATNPDFTDLDETEWQDFARLAFRETSSGGLQLTYDPALSRGFAALDLTKPQPTAWPLFDAMKSLPVMVIRGEYSDLLSQATVNDMAARHAALVSFTAPHEAHAPLLGRPKTAEAIARFVEGLGSRE